MDVLPGVVPVPSLPPRRALSLSLGLTAGSFLAGLALGFSMPSSAVLEVLMAELGGIVEAADSSLQLALLIFLNNMVTALLVMMLSLLVLPGLLVVALNGYVLGLVAWWVAVEEGLGFKVVAAGVLPHGVIEIPAFIAAASSGVYCALSCRSLGQIAGVAGRVIPLVAAALLIAALIEAFITPVVLESVAGVEVQA